jgi:hypothetical protein
MPKDGDLHDRFYNGWERPDMGPGFGCCHKQDCYPTKFRRMGGKWYALRRKWVEAGVYEYLPEDEAASWIHIPEHLFEHNLVPGQPAVNLKQNTQREPRESPDGQSHVCILMTGGEHGDVAEQPLCAVLGGQG